MKKFSLVLFALGLALSFFPHLYHRLRPFRSFQETVELKTGPILEKKFRAFHTVAYDIELSATGMDDSNQAECLLTGQTSFKGSCNGVQSQVDLSWELLRDSKVIESGSVVGDSASSWSRKTVTRLLGIADLEAGSEYTLKVTSLRNFPQLTPFHPQISIETDAGYFKDRFFFASLIQLLGYVLLGTSAGIRIWLNKRKDPQSLLLDQAL